VRERGGVSTVPMHTCTHAHVCTPTPLCPSHTLVRLASCHTCVYACTPELPRLRPPLRRSGPLPRLLAFVLLCLRPTLPSSYPCTHALSHIDTRPHGPAHSPTASPFPRDARPPRPPRLSPPRHALSLDKYVQAPVPHAHVRAFTIFRTPSLPPLPSPSCPISSRIHAITNMHARTPSCACPTRPTCTLALVPQHAPVACLFFSFPVIIFFAASFVYTMHRIFVFKVAKKKGPELAVHET